MSDAARCPRCGCADLRDAGGLRGSTPGTGKFERKICRNCGNTVRVKREKESNLPDVPKAVIYRPVVCPKCGCDECPITSTISRILRRHKCKQCGHNFKSVKK